MSEPDSQRLADELILKDRWADFLKRFIDVLRVNIFAVNSGGKVAVAPFSEGEHGRYGSWLLIRAFPFDLSGQKGLIMQQFVEHGLYKECRGALGLMLFAIPVKTPQGALIAHLIVGPVILNKRLEADEYAKEAKALGLSSADILDALGEVRVLSYLSVKAILDLLSDVIRDIVGVRLQKLKNPSEMALFRDSLPPELSKAAEDLYAPQVNIDELFKTILETAINLTHAQSGSIMYLDESRGELSIKASHGLDVKKTGGLRLKLGEGIAGLAARENSVFMISKTSGDNRIRHLLKRPEIAQSAVIPLSSQERVFGVLNLSTGDPEGRILANEVNLKNFSKLISSAIQGI